MVFNFVYIRSGCGRQMSIHMPQPQLYADHDTVFLLFFLAIFVNILLCCDCVRYERVPRGLPLLWEWCWTAEEIYQMRIDVSNSIDWLCVTENAFFPCKVWNCMTWAYLIIIQFSSSQPFSSDTGILFWWLLKWYFSLSLSVSLHGYEHAICLTIFNISF